MPERDIMARVAVLEANKEAVNTAIISMSGDIREIRDVMIGANLADLPRRVSDLEKNKWIGHGVSATLGGSFGLGIFKILSLIGVFK